MDSERSSRVVWRWFWAWDDDREERWLADMARQGWHLRGPAVLRFTFDRGEPAEVVYRLDYHILRGEERAEYLALFRAAGWEHVGEVANWHYFRTPAADGAAADIFSDAESRAAKYRRLLVLLLALLPILLSSLSRLLRRPSGEPPRLLGWLLNGSLVFYVALLVFLAYVLVRIALKIMSVRAGKERGGHRD